MRSALNRCLTILLILGVYVSSADAQAAREPLTDSKLIALVPGGTLSEDIVREIESRGLAFRPGDQYRSLITTAGPDVQNQYKAAQDGLDAHNSTQEDAGQSKEAEELKGRA